MAMKIIKPTKAPIINVILEFIVKIFSSCLAKSGDVNSLPSISKVIT